jgi:hypothetical protein
MKLVIGIATVVGLALGGIGSASADFSDYSAGFDQNVVVVEDVSFETDAITWGGVARNNFFQGAEIFYWE